METINVGARFSPTPESVPAARRFVLEQTAQAVALPEEVTVDLALLVSEVVTNAVIHARTPFLVEVLVTDRLIRVAIEDEAPDLPRPREVTAEATTGRGLLILDRLADRWGATPVGGGKRVWFERLLDAAWPQGRHRISSP